MRVGVAVALAGLFLLAFVPGEIYAPAIAIGVFVLLLALQYLSTRGLITRNNIVLALWVLLLSHRAFIFRGGSAQEGGSLFYVEVGVTLGVLAGALAVLAPTLGNLRLKTFDARFWLVAYTALAGLSLIWTPAMVYSGFWFIRLLCVAILLVVYFAEASIEDCRKFFAATILGSVPVLLLPIIAFGSLTTTALSGSHRVLGFWAHPGVVTIAAFSIAAGCLAAILQPESDTRNRRFYYHAPIFGIACVSGFLAAGKTGAAGGAIAVSFMLLIGGQLRLWLSMFAIAGASYVIYAFFLQNMEMGLIAHAESYNFERSTTVQGRFSLWIGSLSVWWESIQTVILGRGFTSFRAANLASLTGWAPGHAHNSFVNLLVDMGILGTIAFLAMVFRPFYAATMMVLNSPRKFSHSAAFPLYIALISLLVGALMDDVFGGTLQPTTYLFIGTVIALDRLVYLLRQESPAPSSPDYAALPSRGRKLQPVLEARHPSR